MQRNLILLIIIAAIGVAVYINSITSNLLWDDEPLIKNNVYIKSFSHIPKIFTSDIGRGAMRKSNSYRPLQIFTYMLDYSLWKLDGRGYHIINILFHILTALSLYWFSNILFNRRLLSFFASLLFVVHPVHTEAVAYISGRADPLALFLMLLAFIFYIKSDSRRFFILTIFTYLLALLSRESSLMLPIFIIIYHYSFKIRIKPQAYLSILVTSAIYIIVRVIMLEYIVPRQLITTTLIQRIPGFFAAIAEYMRLLVSPIGLHMEYGDRLFKITDPRVIAGILILALAAYYAFKRRGNSIIFFPICWFFAGILPSSNLYPINAYMAEHWLYMPSIGFFLITASVLERLYLRKELKAPVTVIIACIVCALSFLTIRQNNFWREPVAFYERTLRYAPESARVYYNLANSYKDVGDYEKAKRLYERAIEIKPDYEYAYNNFGILFYDMSEYEKAISLYKKAIEANPGFAESYNNLGNALSALGLYAQAIDSYKLSLEKDPNYAYAHNNLGLAYYELGRYQEAIACYKKALELNPAYAYAYNNIGMIYYKQGKYNDAIGFFRKAAQLDPDYSIAYYNMSVAYYNNQQYDLSVRACEKAIKLGLEVDPNLLNLLEPYRKR